MFKKSLLVLSAFLLVSLSSFALAKVYEDFCQEDYDRLMNGDKNMVGGQLEGADLSGKSFRGVDFRGAELEKVNFQNADLSFASFKNADLEDANLKGAKIEGANFANAELEFATWVDGRVCAEGSLGGCW